MEDERSARIAARKAEDAERHRLSELDRLQPQLGKSRLLLWTLQREAEDMAKSPGRKPKAVTQAKGLLAALKFVSIAGGRDELPYQQHIMLGGNRAIMTDGQISAAHPIVEDLQCCPHLERLQAAIQRCGKSLAITLLDTGRLSIKGDKLNALVPCLSASDIPWTIPDNPLGVVDDRIKTAFGVCGALASENAAEVLSASLLLESGQCTGTNRAALMQYWHGIDLPPGMIVPKIFAAAVCKSPYALEGFGASWNEEGLPKSLTFYFAGGSWLKTSLYLDRWPDITRIINGQSFPAEVPAGLFEAIEAVGDFTENGVVNFCEGKVQSHLSEGVGAQYDVPGLQGGKSFAYELMGKIAPFVKAIDYTTHFDRAFFFGENMRGVIMACYGETQTEPTEAPVQPTGSGWASNFNGGQ